MGNYIDRTKTDDPPINPSGIKEIGYWELDRYFLTPFTGTQVDSSRRLHLVNRLSAYLSLLQGFGIQIEIWVDGSFTTKKQDPDDIDIVVWAYNHEIDTLSPTQFAHFNRLTKDRELVRASYDIDVYVAPKDDPDEIEYWTGEFSKRHKSQYKKGFFKIVVPHV